MIHILSKRATSQQMQEMLEELKTYVKVAVDVRRHVVAGGGALHADCQAVLLDDGSEQADIWGADWIPASQEVRFESLINIRPKQHNRTMTIHDSQLRAAVEAIVKQWVPSA